ncbi:MAG: DNA recombination protein RmuC [FCB group bacterium]|nr:DNA recombination protein RmuC [FCB group bacterium]
MNYIVPILLFILGFIIGGGIIWFIKRSEIEATRVTRDNLRELFGSLSRDALDQNQKSFFELAQSQFEQLSRSSVDHLNEKKKLIDVNLKEMKSQLESLNRQTSELKGQIEQSRTGIQHLENTTSQLRQILSSSQARGQWGERMVEDILHFIGLKEGLNYSKQSTQESGSRPDYTFFLPRGKFINMDVKFPLDHYERFLSETNESQRDAEKKQFLTDVRKHIKAVASRDYIVLEKGSVDYVLLFIPNESIYSFLNQEDKELIDYSLNKKILLCSPITLYAILSLIRQAVTNFSMEQRAGEMQKQVGIFKEQWTRFVDKMDRVGTTLGTAQKHFEDLTTTRTRQLERPMEKILEMEMETQPDKLEHE